MSLSRSVALIVLVALLLAAGWWRFSPDKVQTVRRSQIIMGTIVEVTVIGNDRDRIGQEISAAFAEMGRIEQLMSRHIPTSEVSQLSRARESFSVSKETAQVVAEGLKIEKKAGGAFRLTMGQLIDLWDILAETPRVPSTEKVQAAVKALQAETLSLDGQRVHKSAPELKVDLGSIAKGYAIDRATALLTKAGFNHFSVNAGGDLRVRGDRHGRPWRIGIQHPRKTGKLLALLPAVNEAIVTSGDYERFFEVDGVRYHHLLDPRTGQPARGLQSVTVVAPTALEADGLATAAFVLGPVEGLKLLQRWPQTEGLLVAADGSKIMTTGLKDRLQWP